MLVQQQTNQNRRHSPPSLGSLSSSLVPSEYHLVTPLVSTTSSSPNFVTPNSTNNNNINNNSNNSTLNDSDLDLILEFDSVASLHNKNNRPERPLQEKEEEKDSNFPAPAPNMSDAYLSNVGREHLNRMDRKVALSAPNTPPTNRAHLSSASSSALMMGGGGQGRHMLAHDKKEKMEYNQMMMMRSLNEKEGTHRPLSYHGRSGSVCLDHNPLQQQQQQHQLQLQQVNKRHIMSSAGRNRKESLLLNRRSMPNPFIESRQRDKIDDLETNLPRIDLEAIETHLRQAREEERKRRSDREEIRRRLALEADGSELGDKLPRKHNLHSRLQSSMNLQICFMNETASDSESPNSDNESHHQQQSAPRQPQSLPPLNKMIGQLRSEAPSSSSISNAEDFFAKQARLQAEARQALAQAKELARLHLTQERDKRSMSPITLMVRNSLEKVGVSLPPDRRRVSRQLLTEMNVTQLQVIVNDLHSHIEKLNENLVSMLLERDDLHMEQDSMLVDIEDLTRYLAAKYNSPHHSLPLISASQSILGKK